MKDNTALVVIDVQPVFMRDSGMPTVDGDDLVEKCRLLIDRARTQGLPVVYVQHVDQDDMPENADPASIAFHPDIAPRAGDPVVEKHFGSGFLETNLSDVLADLGAQHLVICGLSAYGCVNMTVLFAKLYGYEVTVVRNAVGATDYPKWPVTQGIPTFLAALEKGGVMLAEAASALV